MKTGENLGGFTDDENNKIMRYVEEKLVSLTTIETLKERNKFLAERLNEVENEN